MKLFWWQRWFPFLRRRQCEAKYVIDSKRIAKLAGKVYGRRGSGLTVQECSDIEAVFWTLVRERIVECREMSDHEHMTRLKGRNEPGYQLQEKQGK